MPGLDPAIAIHRLAIETDRRFVKQAPKRMHPDLAAKVEAEVDRLIMAKFIREVQYPVWLANVEPVKKKNGQIRVCIDFRDLNNACPKDDFLGSSQGVAYRRNNRLRSTVLYGRVIALQSDSDAPRRHGDDGIPITQRGILLSGYAVRAKKTTELHTKEQ